MGGGLSPYLFTGQRWDGSARLYNYRMRWYDPYIGRFLTRDPIGIWGDPMNLGNGTAYVGNNPWSYVDPYGLLQCDPKIFDFSNSSPNKRLGPRTLAEIEKQEALMDPVLKERSRLNNYAAGVTSVVENTHTAGKAGEAAAELTLDALPGVGDVKSGVDALSAAREGDLIGVGLGAAGALPFLPGVTRYFTKRSDRVGDASNAAERVRNNTNYSPALKDSPYNPDVVAARNSTRYKENPQHVPGDPRYVPGKSPLPFDAEEVFGRSIRWQEGPESQYAYWGVSTDESAIYRYFQDEPGSYHFSASYPLGEARKRYPDLCKELGI